MRGRKPTPTHLRLVKGNPQRRPLNKREPQAPREFPKCPDHLSALAQEHWKVVTTALDRMNILSSADTDVIAAYCQAYSRWVQAERALVTTGLVIRAPKTGVLMHSPFLSIASRALEQMDRFADRLGLTPQSRVRLEVKGGGAASDDPAEHYFQ